MQPEEKTNEHNMKYKAASSKIQEILADMLKTFRRQRVETVEARLARVRVDPRTPRR